jgi:alpha-1,2-glucosyltransferase
MSSASLSSQLTSLFPHGILILLCTCLTFYWLGKINSIVPEPYLDEVFHVRQSQTYFAGVWSKWDPKITTPPGLYLWSYAAAGVLKTVGVSFEPSTAGLRATNAIVASALLPATVYSLLRLDWIKRTRSKDIGHYKTTIQFSRDWQLCHVALNICLFPPLFFFSSLYYTDLLSVFMVLAAYGAFKSHQINRGKRYSLSLWAFGLMALVFRQTNIFWVSVYLGGLEVVYIVKHGGKESKASSFADVASRSWYNGDIYDPPIISANLEGNYAINPSSVIICG